MAEPAEGAHLPKVLFAIGGLGAGGSETQLCEVVCRLHQCELDAVVLVAVADPGRRLDNLCAAGVPIIETGLISRARPGAVARHLYRQWRAIGSVQPDVVYAWLDEMAFFMAPLARSRRVPVVVARRNVIGANIERLPGFSWGVRRAERLARFVTANSTAVMDHAVERGIEPDRLRLIPNALPPREIVPPPAAPPVRIGYLARMRPEKGHRRLLRVLSLLPEELDWVAKLGGDGVLYGEIQAQAAELGLAARIEFCGEVADAADFWDDCHIGALLSDHEGSPNSLLEAARAGRPLFATAVGGSTELVAPTAGVLVDPGDDRAAAARLAELIADAGLRERLGSGAREMIVVRHDPETVAGMHLAVLRDACVAL